MQTRALTSPAANVPSDALISFSSSLYLDLFDTDDVRRAIRRALDARTPLIRAGASERFFREAESIGASLMGADECVYFSSGYLIGALGMAYLREEIDIIFIDEYAHYNLAAAVQAARRPSHRFRHCDVDHLSSLIHRAAEERQRPLVITDGVFAASGAVAPLDEYQNIVAPLRGRLLVDESHAFGLLGPEGRGAAASLGASQVATIGATLSKAFCAHGALLGVSREHVEQLRQTDMLRASNAGATLSAAAAAAAMKYAVERPEMRLHIVHLAQTLRTRLAATGVKVIDSESGIVAFTFGRCADMAALQQHVFNAGFHILHVTDYIGCGEDGLIRCSIRRTHTRENIEDLVHAIGHFLGCGG